MARRPVVLVTGASSGIGYATALAFARDGYDVVGTARRGDRLEKLKAQVDALDGDHGDLLPVIADVSNPETLQAAVDQALTLFGRLDILIANAGVGHRGEVVGSAWPDVEELLRTNIDGVLHSIRVAVPAIRQGGNGGQIVLVSSIVYNMVAPYFAIYAASKAFVSSIGRSLRLELEPDGIRVTDMLIGRTQSEFSDKRLGQGGRASKSRLPVMSADQVAEAIIKAIKQERKAVAVRWVDRTILLANWLVPGFIGRRAMRQYK